MLIISMSILWRSRIIGSIGGYKLKTSIDQYRVLYA